MKTASTTSAGHNASSVSARIPINLFPVLPGLQFMNTSPLLKGRSEYTCPMHPEIVRPAGELPHLRHGAGAETVAAHGRSEPRIDDMTRRFWVSVVLTVPLLVIAMGDLIPGQPPERSVNEDGRLDRDGSGHACGRVGWGPFFARGVAVRCHAESKYVHADWFGRGRAYVYSLVAAALSASLSGIVSREHGAVPVYFEAAAVITTLVLLGQVLELRARSRTGAAIKALSAWRRRLRAGSIADGVKKMSRSSKCGWEISACSSG